MYTNCDAFRRKPGVSPTGLVLAGISGALCEHAPRDESDLRVLQGRICGGQRGCSVCSLYFILTIIGINGVPEAIVAGILTLCIGKVLMKKM